MHVDILVALMSAGILSGILDTITDMIAQYGYPAIFVAGFLEMVFPIPSEAIFPLVGFIAQSRGLGLENAIGMATVGALGSTAGSILIYFVSLKIGRAAVVRFGKHVRISEHEIEKAERWFEKYGSIAVFAVRMIPAVRQIISIPAGIAKMNFAKFVGCTFAGSLLWCIILTLIGYYLGEAWSIFSEEASSAFDIITIVIIVGIIAGVGLWYSIRRKRASAKQ